jgi:transposase-like protein
VTNLSDIDLETIKALNTRMLELFPTENDCFEVLIRLIIGVPHCNHCKGKNLQRSGDDRSALCLDCRKTTWLTARTFISGIKKKRAWLMALIYRGHGIPVNASELSRVVTVAISSADKMLKKIDAVCKGEMEAIGITLDSRQCSEVIMRRSTQSPTNQHPLVELDEIDQRNALLQKQVQPTALLPDEELIHNLLSDQPTPINSLITASGLPISQAIATLMMLQLAGLAKALPGDNYTKSIPVAQQKKISKQTKDILARYVRLTRATYQGISRRYLQYFLASCWSILDRKRWHFQALLLACRRFGPITDAQILSYVSPDAVLMALVP